MWMLPLYLHVNQKSDDDDDDDIKTVIALGYCQNFVSAQYREPDLGWDCYTSNFAHLQQSYGRCL